MARFLQSRCLALAIMVVVLVTVQQFQNFTTSLEPELDAYTIGRSKTKTRKKSFQFDFDLTHPSVVASLDSYLRSRDYMWDVVFQEHDEQGDNKLISAGIKQAWDELYGEESDSQSVGRLKSRDQNQQQSYLSSWFSVDAWKKWYNESSGTRRLTKANPMNSVSKYAEKIRELQLRILFETQQKQRLLNSKLETPKAGVTVRVWFLLQGMWSLFELDQKRNASGSRMSQAQRKLFLGQYKLLPQLFESDFDQFVHHQDKVEYQYPQHQYQGMLQTYEEVQQISLQQWQQQQHEHQRFRNDRKSITHYLVRQGIPFPTVEISVALANESDLLLPPSSANAQGKRSLKNFIVAQWTWRYPVGAVEQYQHQNQNYDFNTNSSGTWSGSSENQIQKDKEKKAMKHKEILKQDKQSNWLMDRYLISWFEAEFKKMARDLQAEDNINNDVQLWIWSDSDAIADPFLFVLPTLEKSEDDEISSIEEELINDQQSNQNYEDANNRYRKIAWEITNKQSRNKPIGKSEKDWGRQFPLLIQEVEDKFRRAFRDLATDYTKRLHERFNTAINQASPSAPESESSLMYIATAFGGTKTYAGNCEFGTITDLRDVKWGSTALLRQLVQGQEQKDWEIGGLQGQGHQKSVSGKAKNKQSQREQKENQYQNQNQFAASFADLGQVYANMYQRRSQQTRTYTQSESYNQGEVETSSSKKGLELEDAGMLKKCPQPAQPQYYRNLFLNQEKYNSNVIDYDILFKNWNSEFVIAKNKLRFLLKLNYAPDIRARIYSKSKSPDKAKGKAKGKDNNAQFNIKGSETERRRDSLRQALRQCSKGMSQAYSNSLNSLGVDFRACE